MPGDANGIENKRQFLVFRIFPEWQIPQSIPPLVHNWWKLTNFNSPKLWFPLQNILKQSPLPSPAIPGPDPYAVYSHENSHCAEPSKKIQKFTTSFSKCNYVLSLSISHWTLAVSLAPIMTEDIVIAILDITRATTVSPHKGKKRLQVSTSFEHVIRILPSTPSLTLDRKGPL